MPGWMDGRMATLNLISLINQAINQIKQNKTLIHKMLIFRYLDSQNKLVAGSFL